ncbi:MAG: FG-GAP repeat domain-containing protein, partial [Gammaproteobacteria bacterium]
MIRIRFFLLVVVAAAVSGNGQQPTGRTYSSSAPVRRLPPAAQYPSPVTFADVTRESSITFKHEASPTSQKYLLETMGGGVALFDFDNDGRMDLYFTNGARLEDPMRENARAEKDDPRYWNRLFHQKKDGAFEDVTARAGIMGRGYSMGVAAGDYDNDGWIDLYVTEYGANILYRNLGDGSFADVTRQAGVEGGGWSASAGWFDADRDGRLDLLVARYLDWNFARGAMHCGEKRAGYRAYCHPDSFPGITSLLFYQQPNGTFKEAGGRARIVDAERKALGVAFADFNDDGWTDIIVANDSVRQALYVNQKNGTFEEIAT